MDHVDEVIHHAAFAAHDEVEVAQADVKVDHGSLVAAQGEAGGKAGTGGGLAHATLAGGHDDDFGHVLLILCGVGTNEMGTQASGSMMSFSPSSRTWAGLPRTSAGNSVSVVR
ncbi:hypothetical protein D3C71_1947610 [compost metagenome]